MAFLPLIFVIAPTIDLLTIKASFSSAKLDTRIGLSLLYMLVIPRSCPLPSPPTPSSANASKEP